MASAFERRRQATSCAPDLWRSPILALLQHEAEDAAKAARSLADWVNGVIALRQGDRAAAARRAEGSRPTVRCCARPVERRASADRTGCQPEGGIVAQRIRVILVAPALCGEQDADPDARGEVMNDIFPALRIGQLRDHPFNDAAAFHDLAQHHSTGISGQPLGAAFDAQGPLEARGERLWRFTRGVLRLLLWGFL